MRNNSILSFIINAKKKEEKTQKAGGWSPLITNHSVSNSPPSPGLSSFFPSILSSTIYEAPTLYQELCSWWYNVPLVIQWWKKKTIHNSLPPDGSYRLAKKIISRHAKKWPFPPAKCHEGEFHVLVHAASWWAEQPSWKKAWFIWGLKSGQEKERKDAPKIKRSPPGKCLTQWRAEASSHRLTPAPPKASLPNSTPSEATLLTWNWPNWG